MKTSIQVTVRTHELNDKYGEESVRQHFTPGKVYQVLQLETWDRSFGDRYGSLFSVGNTIITLLDDGGRFVTILSDCVTPTESDANGESNER